MFEVRSVRLVMRADARHFSRLTNCSKCGREAAGPPVFTPADLERPPQPVVCPNCFRASVTASSRELELELERQQEPNPSARTTGPSATEPQAPAPRPAEPQDDVHPGTIDEEHEAAGAGGADRAEAPAAGDIEPAPRKAVSDRLAEIHAEVTASSERNAAGLAALEAQARRSVEGLGRILQAERSELAALSTALTETRGEVQHLAESNVEVVRRQGELEQRLAEVMAAVSADRGGARIEELERRIEEALDRVGLVPSLEQRLQGDVVTLTQMVEAVRSDVEASFVVPVRERLGAVIEAVQELVRARDAVQASLDGLVGRAGDAEARVAALESAVEKADRRLRAMDERVQTSLDGLTPVIESQRVQLGIVMAALQPVAAEPEPDAEAGQPLESRIPTAGHGGLLHGLERQLQEAEGRLARLTGTEGDGV